MTKARRDTEDMSGHRPRARLLGLAAASAVPALYALWIRPRMLTWGATPDETTGTYPGDELVPDPDGGATMATTLSAPPERAWPWLVQMGGGRGGWYSWDWVDNKGEPSVDRIVPEWQSLEVGGHLEGPTNRWAVVVVEPNRALVLQSSYGLPSGQSFDPRSGPLPRVYVDGIWGFHLRPAPGGRTRLVIPTRSRGHPRLVTRPFGLLVGNPCTSSCRPASATTCAPGPARRRDRGPGCGGSAESLEKCSPLRRLPAIIRAIR